MFTIAKCGVYAHFVPGVWPTLDAATEAAASMAKVDGVMERGRDEADGYHEWEIWECGPGGGTKVAVVDWETKGHWVRETQPYDRSLRPSVWVPASGLRVSLA